MRIRSTVFFLCLMNQISAYGSFPLYSDSCSSDTSESEYDSDSDSDEDWSILGPVQELGAVDALFDLEAYLEKVENDYSGNKLRSSIENAVVLKKMHELREADLSPQDISGRTFFVKSNKYDLMVRDLKERNGSFEEAFEHLILGLSFELELRKNGTYILTENYSELAQVLNMSEREFLEETGHDEGELQRDAECGFWRISKVEGVSVILLFDKEKRLDMNSAYPLVHNKLLISFAKGVFKKLIPIR